MRILPKGFEVLLKYFLILTCGNNFTEDLRHRTVTCTIINVTEVKSKNVVERVAFRRVCSLLFQSGTEGRRQGWERIMYSYNYK